MRNFSRFLGLVTFLMGLTFLPHGLWAGIEYDRGAKKKERQYLPVTACTHTPCTITQWGAIRFPKQAPKSHRVQLGVLHRGSFSSIALFQESTTFEQKLSERIFNRRPTRNIVNLERLIETGQTDTVYVYGILLQYELDEGDMIGIRLTSLKDPKKVEEYFFRYHHDAAKFDIDIAVVQPINIFTPNPGKIIQAAYSTASLSFSMARALDPDRHYSFFRKVLRAGRFNLITGILLRHDARPFNGDLITKELFDGYAGLGLTFFDFLSIGYGGNIFQSPHTTFPFVGIEVRHLFEFLRGLKSDTHTRWQGYLKDEMARQPSN